MDSANKSRGLKITLMFIRLGFLLGLITGIGPAFGWLPLNPIMSDLHIVAGIIILAGLVVIATTTKMPALFGGIVVFVIAAALAFGNLFHTVLGIVHFLLMMAAVGYSEMKTSRYIKSPQQ